MHSCLRPLLLVILIALTVVARPATDYFDNSPYSQEDGIAIDFVTVTQTKATMAPKKRSNVEHVKTNRVNRFLSTWTVVSDANGAIQWLANGW